MCLICIFAVSLWGAFYLNVEIILYFIFIARFNLAWIIKRWTMWLFVDSVNSRLFSCVIPILKIKSARIGTFSKLLLLRLMNTNTLPRALWPIMSFPTILLMSNSLWSNHKWHNLIINLLRMNCKQLLKSKQTVHLYSLEIILLGVGSCDQTFASSLECLLLLVDQ